MEIFIGLRYLRTRQQNSFVSFITLASLIGVALGVAALIVVLSIMNGFENELRGRLLSMTSHATVAAARGGISDWRELIARAQQQENVVGAAPYVQLQGMLANGPKLNGALVRGINPLLEKTVDRVGSFMVEGTLDDLNAAGYNMVLGRLLALRLGVDVGDRVTLLVPQTGLSAGDIRPRVSRFTVSGIFEAGIQEHDGALALVNLADAATLAGLGDAVTGIRLQFDDVFAAPAGIKTFA
ncbi:MAG: ABC transporter permease, partial [Gammaproteobacteria bacterium]